MLTLLGDVDVDLLVLVDGGEVAVDGDEGEDEDEGGTEEADS